MKKIKYIIILFIMGLMGACDLNGVLEETPKDFLSPEISYVDRSSFESALANVYLTIRNDFYQNKIDFLFGYDVDMSIGNYNFTTEKMHWNTLNADNSNVKALWQNLYNIIFQANTIIARAEGDNVSWESEEDKNSIVGEAKFLRAFAYHFLGNMWGGVPLNLEETTSAKFDYTRGTRKEVYTQCKKDLEFAVQWMPTVDKLKGGRAPRAAAYHLLSEVNICLEDYDGAIAAASKVIDDPNFHLMTERFGQWTDFTFNGYNYQGENKPWGDVYWDLFRENNMNWLEGNHEAIWNVEFDFDMLGGGNTNTWGGNFALERFWGPNWWQPDINGSINWLKDTLSGRPAGAYQTTNYVETTLWEYKNDWDRDIRNSKYNVQREFYWRNPSSEFYGQLVANDNVGWGDGTGAQFFTFPYFQKLVTTLHHGAGHSNEGQAQDWGRIFKDWYIMRLAETYLLRAEAFYRKGDNASAAADINAVRNRAQATPVSASDVDLDLILDERARELFVEDFRLNTLMRMGKLSEYLMKYNDVVINLGYSLDDHLNLFPIPSSEIEANKEAVLEQNPGY